MSTNGFLKLYPVHQHKAKPLTTTPKWKAYLQLSRISNSPTVLSNALAGFALAAPLGWNFQLGLVTLSAFLFYTAGMILNDVCDAAIDAKERPDRPIPSGVVGQGEALAVASLVMLGGVSFAAFLSMASFVASLILVGLIILYDMWHKNNPLSPLLMGLCRGAVYAMAYFVMKPAYSQALSVGVGSMIVYILSLTWIARSESSFQLKSIAPAILPFLPIAALGVTGEASLRFLMTAGCYALWMLYSLRFVYVEKHRNIGKAVGSLIAGVALLDAMVLATHHGTWVGIAVALGCFVSTLLLQQFIKGN